MKGGQIVGQPESVRNVTPADDPDGTGRGADGGRHTYDARAITDAPGVVSTQNGSQSGNSQSAMARALARWGTDIEEPAPADDPETPSPFPGVAAGFKHLHVIRHQPPSMPAIMADYRDGYRKAVEHFGGFAAIPYHFFGIPGLACCVILTIARDSCVRPARFAGFLLTITIVLVGLMVVGVF